MTMPVRLGVLVSWAVAGGAGRATAGLWGER